jgi:type IV fimbrial biogenesis protein FimT
MKHISLTRGFTLAELLVVITIITLVSAYAIPSFTSLITKSRQKGELSELISLINLSRNTAIHQQVTVTLCPVNSQKKCDKDWSKPLVAFKDPDRDGAFSSRDDIVRSLPPQQAGYFIGHTGIHRYFRFRPSGLAVEAIGNIIWCPDDHDATYAYQIRINMGGRPFIARDTNNDGIAEDAQGNALSCL